MAEDDNCDEFEITGECEQDPETMKFDEIIGALEAGGARLACVSSRTTRC